MPDQSPPVSVPRLHTARLTLREYRMSDFDRFAANLADEDAMTFVGVQDRRTAWRIFGCNTGGWLLQGVGWWAVELRDGTLVGNVGAFFREPWPEIEIGWNTMRAHWGQGFATEAATEVVRYVFEERRERRVTALIDARNTASLRVAAALGMTYEADTEIFGKIVGRYVRAAPRGGA
ncbi:MAG: GNAT family N-acetyltransferase [Polyangiaceae bacterium]